MANRFWVGGSAAWDGTAGTKWSTTSGGGGGSAVPTAIDDVFFDGPSGAVTVTISGTASAKSLTCTGFTGALSGGTIAVSGNVTLVAGMSSPSTTNFSVIATCSFTSGGKTIANFTTSGSATTLADNLACSALTISAGSFNASNKDISATNLLFNGGSLTMGSGTWTLTGTGVVFDGFGSLTFNAGTSVVRLTGAAPWVAGGLGYTFNKIRVSGIGAGPFRIDESCTLEDDNATAHTVRLSTDIGTETFLLAADLNNSAVTLSFEGGTFDAANHNVTVKAVVATLGSGTKPTLTMGSGTITLTGTGTVWDYSASTTATLTPGAWTIKINDASAATKTFAGGGHTYNALWLTGAGSGAFIITGSNSFGTLTLDTPPHDVQFESGSTQIITAASISGSASGLMTLEPVGAAAWDLTCLAGISASYLALRGSHAHGGAFIAANSFDAGDNTNWDFVRSSSTAIYLDSAYQYTGAAIGTVESLNWLIGETLGVLADGVDIGDATVDSHGRLVLPDGLSHSAITVGKRYLSRGVTLRAPTAGNQDGSALGRQMVIKQVFADILDTGYLGVGSLAGVEAIPPPYRQTNPGDLYTAMYEASIDDSHLNEGIIVFETDRAYPATLRALQMAIESAP